MSVRATHSAERMDPSRPSALLRLWLHGAESASTRWAALESLSSSSDGNSDSSLDQLLHRLASFIERDHLWKVKLRRRAAVALLKLSPYAPDNERLQRALARSLALALPRRLAKPLVIDDVMEAAMCEKLIAECRASSDWTSLHRRYSTHDLPIDRLPSGACVSALVRQRVLPMFAAHFGSRYGPGEELQFVHGSGSCGLFVVRYACDGDGGSDGHHPQRGLAGHIDESLCSFVLALSDTADFTGGGTRFEGTKEVIRPPRGSAVLFLGKVWHQGMEITSGERFVLVGLANRRADNGADASSVR